MSKTDPRAYPSLWAAMTAFRIRNLTEVLCLRVRDVREHKDATIVLEDTVIRGDHRDRVMESEPEPDLSATE